MKILTDRERTKLRKLQDAWLALPTTGRRIKAMADEGEPDPQITSESGAPRVSHVRAFLLPDWAWVFEQGVRDEDKP